jgi:hypothetical protein
VSAKAEKSPLLEAVTRKRMLKTLQTGDDLMFAAVIYKAWRLAVLVQLLVAPNRVHDWFINPFANPNPVYRHRYIRDHVE